MKSETKLQNIVGYNEHAQEGQIHHAKEWQTKTNSKWNSVLKFFTNTFKDGQDKGFEPGIWGATKG